MCWFLILQDPQGRIWFYTEGGEVLAGEVKADLQPKLTSQNLLSEVALSVHANARLIQLPLEKVEKHCGPPYSYGPFPVQESNGIVPRLDGFGGYEGLLVKDQEWGLKQYLIAEELV